LSWENDNDIARHTLKSVHSAAKATWRINLWHG
jgi:hypothetical protein